MQKFNRSIAVVIGINEYRNGITKLSTAINDSEAIAQILEAEHSYEVTLLRDKEATLSGLRELLHGLQEGIGENDRLLFYFAGHGIALNGEDGPEGYLIPQDANLGDIDSYLPMLQLQGALSCLPCRHFLGILDCCFAGAFRWSGTRDIGDIPRVIYQERYERFIQDPAWQIITSADYNQKATDLLTLNSQRGQIGKHSPFAIALMEALEGRADVFPAARNDQPAGDGVITATELYLYVRDRVESVSERNYRRQTPGLWPLKKHDKGEYIFLTPAQDLNLPPAPDLDESQNPYRGLEQFEAEHRELFFGRTALTKELYDSILNRPLIVVLGASGSGKSSLIKAGVIPLLAHSTTTDNKKLWRVLAPMRPGKSPLRALKNILALDDFSNDTFLQSSIESKAKSLSDSLSTLCQRYSDSKLLLVVDQFEELITLCKNKTEREAFLRLLANAMSSHLKQLHIVLVLRSDFESQFQEKALKNCWEDARFLVSAMTRNELRQVIEEPASKKVVFFQPHDLIEKLINEVAQMPGALPLLSFTLSELYLKLARRYHKAKIEGSIVERAITNADYEDLGGVTRCLTQRADLEYEALVQEYPSYQHMIRLAILRMVTAGGELARRRVYRSEFEYPKPQNEVIETMIQRFKDTRLLISDKDNEGRSFVEPAHDALIMGWERLIAWKKEEEKNLILQRRLTVAAEEWNHQAQKEELLFSCKSKGIFDCSNQNTNYATQIFKRLFINSIQRKRSSIRQSKYLWNSDPRLDLLKKILNSDECWFNETESQFVQNSIQKRQNNKWTRCIGFSSIIIAAIGILFLFRILNDKAQLNQANSLGRSSMSLLNEGKDLDAYLQAIKAGKILLKHSKNDPEVIRALQRVVNKGSERNRLEGYESLVTSTSLSNDGKILASSHEDSTITLWDVATGKELRSIKDYDNKISILKLSADGKIVISSTHFIDNSSNATIKIWDAENGKEMYSFKPNEAENSFWVESISLSADGKTLAIGGNDKVVKLWNTETGKEIRTIVPSMGRFFTAISVSLSADGKILASGNNDHTIIISDVETGKEIHTFNSHKDPVDNVSLSADGKTLVSKADSTIKLWDVETGKEIHTFSVEVSESYKSHISLDAEAKIMILSSNQKIEFWNLETGEQIRTLNNAHKDYINSMSLDANGKTLVTSSEEIIKLWNIETEKGVRTLNIHDDREVEIVSLSANGKTMASSSFSEIKLVNTETGHEIHALDTEHPDSFIENGIEIRPLVPINPYIDSMSLSANGRILAYSFAGDIEIKNAETWKSFRKSGDLIPIAKDDISSLSLSANGKTLVYGYDTSLKLENLERTVRQIYTLKNYEDSVRDVSLSADGKTLAFTIKNEIKLMDAKTREEVHNLFGYTSFVDIISLNDNGQTLASSNDRTIKLWNVETGKEIHILRGHDEDIKSLSFGADGQILASSDGQTIKLWDVKTGKEFRTLDGHTDIINSVSMSDDGKTLVSGSDDGTIKLWSLDLNLTSLVARSCDWVSNYLAGNPNLSEADRHLCDGIETIK